MQSLLQEGPLEAAAVHATGGARPFVPSSAMALSPSPKACLGGVASGVVRLLNSTVNVCLVYGIDDTCSRELEVMEEGDIHSCYDALLQREIKLHFLQILAPGQIYPERAEPSPGHTGTTSPTSPAHLSPPTSSPEESSIMTVHSTRFNVEVLGLTWETVETLHWFIFPEGPRLLAEDLEPSVVPMMLTNIDGARSYAAGLRFSRPFFIQKPKNSHYYTLIPWRSSMQPPAYSRLIYLPTCCVLVSQQPYFNLMKDTLSGFYHVVTDEDEEAEFWEVLKDYAERLFLVPSPPQGMLAVEFQLPGFSSSLLVRPPRGDQYLDIRLNYPFLCLSVDSVLQVMAALLTEQRIVFLSALYPMLTYCIQCFLTYISPFDWRHPCVPILPYQLLEYLEAPGTNIMGCHSSIIDSPELQQVEDAVIVDLDSGTVTCRLHERELPRLPLHAVEIFKSRYEQLTKKRFSIEQLQKLSHMSALELERQRSEFEYQMDDSLSKMFLELMVNTYNHVTDLWLQSRLKYEEALREMAPEDQDFYKCSTSTDMFSSFYASRRMRTHRDDFTLLAERQRRLRQRKSANDEDIASALQHTPYGSLRPTPSLLSTTSSRQGRQSMTVPASYRSHSSSVPASHIPPPIMEDSVHSTSPVSIIAPQPSATPTAELVRLELPPLHEQSIDRGLFLEEVIESLSELLQNKLVKAQCVYLRAFYRICQRDFLEALDDFYDTLQRLEIQLVPGPKTIAAVVSQLSPEQQAMLQEKTYHKLVSPRKKALGSSFSRKQQTGSYNIVNIEKKMPKKPLNLNDFLKIVSQNAIATDAESASNLHRVLSEGRNQNIPPDKFQAFYEAWKGVLQDNEAVDLPGMELEREKSAAQVPEQVLAVSPPQGVRTNFGTQSQLVLTTFRVLAVTSFRTYTMADLRKPIRFDKCDLQLSILGAKSPGLRVEPLEKASVASPSVRHTRGTNRAKQCSDRYIGFQDAMDRENWYRMIVEMTNGWKLSLTRKDHCIMETAQCHVILQNAVSQSGLLDRYNHSQRIKVALRLLSFQSKDVSEVSKLTVEALQYRINPCLHEPERQTVESLLYIPPTDPFDDGQGKLWIGLGNGRLKVYDMEARCFESDIKITESRHGKSVRLSCLLLVGKQVWVGSFSRNIHILDAETVCHVSQLSYLEDAPRDLALSQTKPDYVWALLLNGILLAWHPETRTRVAKMQVPLSDDHAYTTCTCFTIWRDLIWVGTNRGSIAVMDSIDGTCIQELFFPGGRRRQVEIKHLALSNADEVWCSVYSVPRAEDSNFIAVFDPQTRVKKLQYSKLDNRVSIILPVSNTMWCGTKSGKIYIFHATTYAEKEGMPKILSAHDDFIRAMTMTDVNLVVSGSGSNDGYAAVWKTFDMP